MEHLLANKEPRRCRWVLQNKMSTSHEEMQIMLEACLEKTERNLGECL
jgi:hypothetical protein